MTNKGNHGSPISATATHATSAVASQAAVAGKTHYITDISGSSDKAGSKILVKDGTTTIWQDNILVTAAGACSYNHTFDMPLKCSSGALASVTVDGTAICNANLSGFSLDM